jgi:hypothetical protein
VSSVQRHSKKRRKSASHDSPSAVGDRGRLTLELAVPRIPSTVGATAVIGSAALAAAIASGHLPHSPGQVWPLVVLNVAGMAYDLGRKALGDRRSF